MSSRLPSSPSTPSHKRHSHSLTLGHTSSTRDSTSTTHSGETTFSRRRSSLTSVSSRTSSLQPSPTTPRPPTTTLTWSPSSPSATGKNGFQNRRRSRRTSSIHSARSINDEKLYANDLNPDLGGNNLADELGQSGWDEYDEQETDGFGRGSSFLDGLREGSVEPTLSTVDGDFEYSPFEVEGVQEQDMGLDMADQSLPGPAESPLRSPRHTNSENTIRKDSRSFEQQKHMAHHQETDFGLRLHCEDFDQLPPSLAQCFRDIEGVSRESVDVDEDLGEDGGVVQRTTRALKVLSPQSSVENGCTRLMTAYTSMATHRTHKTRDLFSQAHPLLYGPIVHLPEDMMDMILDEITVLIDLLPFTTRQNPLLSLHILATDTGTLLTHLRQLTDTLQECRAASNIAARRLKTVRDMLDEMRLEHELTGTSIMLIQAGDWDRRCRERQAAKTCREALQGFTETMNLAREQWVRTCELDHHFPGVGGDSVALVEAAAG